MAFTSCASETTVTVTVWVQITARLIVYKQHVSMQWMILVLTVMLSVEPPVCSVCALLNAVCSEEQQSMAE